MEQFVMEARKRDKHGSGAARAYRREGLIPGVVYGHGEEPISILVPARQFQALLRHHGTLIDLRIEGRAENAALGALLQDTQRDPVSRQVLSIDLQWVSLTESVEVHVPVVLVGAAPGVTRDGGSLDQVMHEVAISCLPTDIPEHLTADISSLEMGHSLHVRDLVAPEGVTVKSPADDAVVTITRPVRAEELEVRVEEAEAEVVGEEKTEAEKAEEKGE